MSEAMKAGDALRWVEAQGVVLAAAKGPAPRLIDAIAGETIAGNWWSHPRANAIYNVLTQVQASPELLVCRLLGGKVTLVHRRLWPALVRLAGRFAPAQLARVSEEHTPSGRHASRQTPYPEWVPQGVLQQGGALGEAEALAAFGRWLPKA